MRVPSLNDRQALALLLVIGAGTPMLIAGISNLPKDPAYAADSRFAQMLCVCAAGSAGVIGFILALRLWRDCRLQRAYGAASTAVNDTLSYLKHERRLARRGQLITLAGAMLALTLYIVSHWPQAGALTNWQTAFALAALIFLAWLPVRALRNRGHYVNAFFLRRYLRQQLDHLGYRPRRAQRRSNPNAKITIPRKGSFIIEARNGPFEWHFDDFVKNAVVFGQVGSGKTVAVLNAVLEGMIATFAKSDHPVGGLILDAKGDFYGKVQKLCEKYKRSNDLLIVDPAAWHDAGGTWRSIAWNPLDNDDDPLEVATRLIAALRLIGVETGSEGSFFLDSAKVYLRHAIALVRGAAITPAPSILDVYRLSQESEAETPLYHTLIRAIGSRYPQAVPAQITDAVTFMEKEWAAMADRQKSGVRGTITQLLDEFLVAPFHEIFTQASTVSIGAMIDSGKLLYVHMPASDRERMSRLVNTLIKLEYQRAILARPNKRQPTFFLCDEFQTFYTSGEGRGDSDFFERSRESVHANIIAAQNLSAFMKRTRNHHDVKNFLGNCAVKIFLRQTEEETNRWASGLFGQRSEIVVTTSEQAAIDGSWSRRRHTSYGRATKSLPRVPSDAFIRLAIPVRGDKQQRYAGSIIHLASRGSTQQPTLDWPIHPLS
ncbi:MAG: type IV secretion system DNA-binding domain-containing protein [Alphaproteobacteria bacterium]|nr:type IV secretion system DNA-binding domain-containing protein [Alphaproteobacteria bacterium]